VEDTSLPPKVKKNAADAVTDIASYLGRDFSSTKLIPLITSLLNEENVDVKLTMIKGLQKLAEVIGSELISPSLCTLLNNTSKNAPQWRLREAVNSSCVDITKHVGEEIFTRSLQDIYFNFLTDPISEVRVAGTSKLSLLVGSLGADWVSTELYPKLQDIYHQRNSLTRITVLHALAKLNLSVDQLSTIVYFAAKDNVANVRLVLCKVLKEIGSRVDISGLKK
jgi:hypothetical protein